MYCPSCNTPLEGSPNYCSRCGVRATGAHGVPAPPVAGSSAEAYVWAAVVTTLATLGIILGGMIALKGNEFPMDAVYAFMTVCFVIGMAVNAALIWQMARLNSGAARAGGARPQPPVTDTGRLAAAYAPPLPEPSISVTEDTTRRLEAMRRRETQ